MNASSLLSIASLLVAGLLAPAPLAAQDPIDLLVPSPGDSFESAGHAVALGETRAVLGAPHAQPAGLESGTVYVFQSSGGAWSQEAELQPNDAAAGRRFGWSVAVEGSRVVVGAPAPNAIGAIYVFQKGIGGWSQTKLTASDGWPDALFGWAVALDGDRIVVGSPGSSIDRGAVYVFEQIFGGAWIETERIEPIGVQPGDEFGTSVALDGDRLVGGSPYADDLLVPVAGAAYVFERQTSGWSNGWKLIAQTPTSFELFGSSVGLAGERVAVGAPGAAGGEGAVDTFEPSGAFGAILFDRRLQGHDTTAGDALGSTVAFEGTRIVTAAEGGGGPGAPPARGLVFESVGGLWYERAALVPSGLTDQLGSQVALHGDRALVGDPGDDTANVNAGGAHLFELDLVEPSGCLGLNPSGTLVELDGVPALGKQWTLGVHNPLGTQTAGSLAFVALSLVPAGAAPCGVAIPGLGMAGAGASGELIVATTPNPVLVGGAVWDGVTPEPVAIPISSSPSLAGLTLYAQGALLGAPGSDVEFALTEGIETTIAVQVP